MFNPLKSLVCSCITPYSDLIITLALYFKKISLSALPGSSRARCSVMTPPAVLKRPSEGTKRTEISGTWYHFGRNRSRNRIRKNGRISGKPEPEPDIRYIPTGYREGMLNLLHLCGLERLSLLNQFHVLLFHVLHFHVLQFHVLSFGPSFSRPAISCLAHWSFNFMSCYFMPCKLVRLFHVLHFQRPHAPL